MTSVFDVRMTSVFDVKQTFKINLNPTSLWRRSLTSIWRPTDVECLLGKHSIQWYRCQCPLTVAKFNHVCDSAFPNMIYILTQQRPLEAWIFMFKLFVVLRFNIPANNVSVNLGQRHYFLAIYKYCGEFRVMLNDMAPCVGIKPRPSRFGVQATTLSPFFGFSKNLCTGHFQPHPPWE